MDKSAIKKYAVWARNELIERVSQKADQYEISAEADPNADSAHGELLTSTEKKQRTSLIAKVKNDDFDQVIEEVAYTWFNRFAALRFMEVNNYLPSRVRVFTNSAGEFKPEILTEAIHLELDGLDMEKVYAFKDANDNEALFKYLIITQCNALSSVLPGMFQKIEDYTELLFPDNLLREGSVIQQMIELIPEEDWKDQVQIIGWLYQYYNTEPKDKVFADLKKKKKITKDKIPAATQLFTPDWIVRYMVENSLGHLWVEGHPAHKKFFLPTEEEQDHYIQTHEDDGKWHYYLEEAKQEPEVQEQLDKIYREYSALKPEDILCVDPCMGSGHILCYLFDVMMQIYEAYGYTSRDAALSIVKNNLYGLDIDDRAAQLAYFSVIMKACQYDKRFLTRGVQPHVYAIKESNYFDTNMIDYFTGGRKELKTAMNSLISDFHDAKEYGSILNVTQVDFSTLSSRFDEIRNENPSMYTSMALEQLLPLVQVAEAMAQKYHVVVTNPPYMSASNMDKNVQNYVRKYYPNGKGDLFATFIERCHRLNLSKGFQANITQQAWMFLSSYEKLRDEIRNLSLVNMAHLGPRAFDEIGGEVVQTTAFVIRNISLRKERGIFCKLVEETSQSAKEIKYLKHDDIFIASLEKYGVLPGKPIAYWVNDNFVNCFLTDSIYRYSLSASQNITGNNDRFLRKHWEIRDEEFGKDKWIFYAKGGEYRRWWGNLVEMINWRPAARYIYEHGDGKHASQIIKPQFWYKKGITWGIIAQTSFRILPEYATFDKQGSSIFVSNENDYLCILGFLNTKVAQSLLDILNTSLALQVRDVRNLPYKKDKILKYHVQIEDDVKEAIKISKEDWDSFEISWDFNKNPLIKSDSIKNAFLQWEKDCEFRVNQLKRKEEDLNRIFINIYNLQDELNPIEEEKDVTVRKADLSRDIRSFISYAVGCMFGRYSLDVDGLAYAGGDWDDSKYKTFIPDKDAILPITDDEYFSDDIVSRLVEFVKVVYGEDTLEENLKFIADALGGKGTPREVLRNYFLKDFFKDHCKTYQKRPIYWLFDSGKKNGFKCLVYMHRYQPDTIARIRTDYVHEQQARYRTAIEGLERQINSATTSERVRLNKRLTKLKDQAEETRLYEEKIHHIADQMIEIDLDDGVKHNYAIFQDVLAKIK